MSANSSNNQARKRSRWGDKTTTLPPSRQDASSAPLPATAATASNTAAVSDEQAIRALMESAQQRQKEQDDRRRRSRNDRDDDGPNQKRRATKREPPIDPKEDYYGPAGARAGGGSRGNNRDMEEQDGRQHDDEGGDDEEPVEKLKANFGLSGTLAKGGSGKGGTNVYKGVVLKFREPPEARAPVTQWRLYVFKKGQEKELQTLHISKQSAYLLGRNEEICDIALLHPSCSSQHAVLQYRALPHKVTGKLHCQPYLMDLESTNGSMVNGAKLDPARYYQLKKGDVLTFGSSTREYVLLTVTTTKL